MEAPQAQHERTLYVALKPDQVRLVSNSFLFVCFSFSLMLKPCSIWQVNALDLDGYLDPEYSDYPYFALRECPVEVALRESYWLEERESVKDLQIVRITFTAVGVTTLFPYVL